MTPARTAGAPAPRRELNPRGQEHWFVWLSGAEIRALFEGRAWLGRAWLDRLPLSRMALDALVPGWDDPRDQVGSRDLQALRRQLPDDAPLLPQMAEFSYLKPIPKLVSFMGILIPSVIDLRHLPWALLLLHIRERSEALGHEGDVLAAVQAERLIWADTFEVYAHGSGDWADSLSIRSESRALTYGLMNRLYTTQIEDALGQPSSPAHRRVLQALEMIQCTRRHPCLERLISFTGSINPALPPGFGHRVIWNTYRHASEYIHEPGPRRAGPGTRRWLHGVLRDSGLRAARPAVGPPDTAPHDEPDAADTAANTSEALEAEALAFMTSGGLAHLHVPTSDTGRHDAANWAAHLIVLLDLPPHLRPEVIHFTRWHTLRGMLNLIRLLSGPRPLPADLQHLRGLLDEVSATLERAERVAYADAVQAHCGDDPRRLRILRRRRGP